ncbi:hypothetical protein [Polaribacter gochangensis]|uniref:hypothetical protein n=1 Tax=Polaribacter gochangensis TaxID=3252903 RepID=UPI003904638A
MEKNRIITPEIKEFLKKTTSIFEKLKKEYPVEMGMMFKEHDQLFAEYGWYIYDGSSLEEVLIILKLLNETNIKKAEEKIKIIFEDNLNEIETDLSKLNKESSQIIKEAFHCHKMKLFYASTILFISLSDGLTKGKLFTKSYIQKIKKKNKNHFLLNIFNDENPVNKNYIPNKSSNSELMRHGIMHGNSTNYGNKINSLKALSLYHFISIRKYKLNK